MSLFQAVVNFFDNKKVKHEDEEASDPSKSSSVCFNLDFDFGQVRPLIFSVEKFNSIRFAFILQSDVNDNNRLGDILVACTRFNDQVNFFRATYDQKNKWILCDYTFKTNPSRLSGDLQFIIDYLFDKEAQFKDLKNAINR